MVDPRVAHLRSLIERLEQAPPSAKRNELLRQVRARVTEVETESPRGSIDWSRFPAPPAPRERRKRPARPQMTAAQMLEAQFR
jgi:hypothetical protein